MEINYYIFLTRFSFTTFWSQVNAFQMNLVLWVTNIKILLNDQEILWRKRKSKKILQLGGSSSRHPAFLADALATRLTLSLTHPDRGDAKILIHTNSNNSYSHRFQIWSFQQMVSFYEIKWVIYYKNYSKWSRARMPELKLSRCWSFSSNFPFFQKLVAPVILRIVSISLTPSLEKLKLQCKLTHEGDDKFCWEFLENIQYPGRSTFTRAFI